MRFFTILMLFTGLAAALVGQPLRVVGTDLLAPMLTPLAAAHLKETGVEVVLELRGTQPALAQLGSGDVDLAVVLVVPGQGADLSAYRKYPLAYQCAIVVVNSANPLAKVDYTQLQSAFGGEDLSTRVRWSDLGGTAAWAQRPVNVRTVEPRVSLAVDFFRAEVLGGRALRPTVELAPSTEELFTRIERDETAIGLAPIPPPSGRNVKVLQVARDANDAPFGPSLENVHLGDYRLRIPVQVAIPRERLAAVRPFLQRLYGEGLEERLLTANMVPLPADEVRQLRAELMRP